MLREIKENAYAKLNLSIDVMGVRDDGYHEMCMVMQSVTLHDDVFLTLTDDGSFSAESNRGFIPNDNRNVAVKAALRFAKDYDMQGKGVHIKLHKRNPVCAGLGGGSTDAAAVLRGMNKMMGKMRGIADGGSKKGMRQMQSMMRNMAGNQRGGRRGW